MEKNLLRIAIAGSVNEGKSSFVGRLLFESNNLYKDQLEEVKQLSEEAFFKDSKYDFSLFTDGLEYEQINHITVDVAYRYMNLSGKKIIIADCPGHFEYNRNMVTACSTSDVLFLVVDSQLVIKNGQISKQSLRHLSIAESLKIEHVAVVISKIDLFPNPEKVIQEVENIFKKNNKYHLNFHFFATSAFNGKGFNEILNFLSRVEIKKTLDRFSSLEIQTTIDNRILLCRAFSGEYFTGQKLFVLPDGGCIQIKKIYKGFSELQKLTVGSGQIEEITIALDLSDEKYLNMTNQIAVLDPSSWKLHSSFKCQLMWFSENGFNPSTKLILKSGSFSYDIESIKVLQVLNVLTNQYESNNTLEANQTYLIDVKIAGLIPFFENEGFKRDIRFIIVDGASFETLAFGITNQSNSRSLAISLQ